MKKLAQLLFIAAIAYANSAFCQRTYYYFASQSIPAQTHESNSPRLIHMYFSGFIVNLNGDTIKGRLRKTEIFGNALLNKVTSGVQRLDFIPDTGGRKLHILLPKDIKAFGFNLMEKLFGIQILGQEMSLVPGQQMIELIPHDDHNLVGSNLGRSDKAIAWWNYESKKVDGLNEFVFLQRLVVGKLVLYDDNMGQRYVSKIDDQDKLFRVDDHLFNTLFTRSEQVKAVMQKYPGFINFERALGIYNLEADGNSIFLNADSSYIVLSDGTKVDENFRIKGIFAISNFSRGAVHKVEVNKKDGQQVEYDGANIKRIVLHMFDSTLVYDAYELEKGNRIFYRLIIDGKVKLYTNPRASIIGGNFPSFLIIKDIPMIIRHNNYDEIAGQIFGDSANWLNIMKSDPSKNNLKNLRENVIFYNAQVNKN
jgi:hypothetical protein